jgi:glycosyltransferase involved in cell wall biosynthesis
MTPLVTIITRTKSRPLLLQRALHSALAQTFQDWQQVIVNDGGDPAPVDRLVAAAADRYTGRSRVLHHDTSHGMEAASNAGLRASTSRYVVIHDDDDTWHPEFLQRTVHFLESKRNAPSVAGVITYTERIVEKLHNDQITKIRREDFTVRPDSTLFFRMLESNTFPPISFLYRRDVFDKIGYYREDLPVLGDWEFNVRFLQAYDIGFIRERLAYYHHRVAATDKDYNNSVVDADDKHKLYDVVLRNEWLRKDLEAGRLGIGVISNMARDLRKKQSLMQRIFGCFTAF